jgi:hypothetical protein
MRANERLSPKRAQMLRDRALAMEMRIACASYEQIADKLQVSVNTAWRYVMGALQESVKRNEATEEVARALEVRRLEALALKHWPRAHDPRSAEVVLKALESKRKLTGLDAPVRVQAEVRSTTAPALDLSVYTDEELEALEALLAKQTRAKVPAGQVTVDAEVEEADDDEPASLPPKSNGANGHGVAA